MWQLVVSCWIAAFLYAQETPPSEPAVDPDPTRFEQDIAAFEASDAESPPEPGGILFVGSSSIKRWDLAASFPGFDLLNRGFGGSQLSDVVHYVDRVVIPYQPRLIVLYEGDNDINAGKSPEQVREDLVELTGRVRERLPSTPIAVLSIKPSPKRWEHWDQMQSTNLLIARLCLEDDRLFYVDVATVLLGRDGRPRPEFYDEDALHLSEEGYRAWSDRLRPILEARTPIRRETDAIR